MQSLILWHMVFRKRGHETLLCSDAALPRNLKTQMLTFAAFISSSQLLLRRVG